MAVRAPEFPAGVTWLNTDRPLSMAELRGHVVLLDFWTYCCINCMHVLPELKALERRFGEDPFVVVGVHSAKFLSEKDPANIRRAIDRYEIEHPVVVDSDHDVWQRFAVRAWPTLCLVDYDGQVAWQAGGEPDRAALEMAVEQLLARGRREGKLAAAPLQIARPAADGDTPLRFPGKVTVVPGAGMQALSGVPPGRGPLDGAVMAVTDSSHNRIVLAELRKAADGWPEAKLVSVVGTGGVGFQDGAFEAASFHHPQGTAFLGQKLFVADTENHALREVSLTERTVRTIAGTGRKGDGMAGTPTDPLQVPLRSPWALATLPGILFVAMAGSHQIWIYLVQQRALHVYAGSGAENHVDGPLNQAALAQPSGLCVGGPYLFFADSEVSSIRAVDRVGKEVVTVLGAGLFDFGDVDGPAENARLQHPLDVTIVEGALYIADTYNNKVRRFRLDTGVLDTLAGEGTGKTDLLNEPGGIDAIGGFLFVADTNNHRVRVVKPESGELRTLDIADLKAP